MDFDTAEYTDLNRAFLQSFLAHSVLTLETARPIIATLYTISDQHSDPNKPAVAASDITVDDLQDLVSTANSAISPLDLEIRSSFHQESRIRYWAICNTSSDALTQLATTYSADEINYVKRLFDEMFDSNMTNSWEGKEAMCLSGRDAINLVRTGRRDNTQARQDQNGQTQAQATTEAFSLTAHEAETLLERMVAEGWLEKSRKGFYTLSVRGLLELKDWLVETYNEPEPEIAGSENEDEKLERLRNNKIKFCHACREIITIGQRCSQTECPCRIHTTCLQNFFRVQRNKKCPWCETDWDGNHFVGEKAITTSEIYLRGRRRGGARPSESAQINGDDSAIAQDDEDD